MSSKTKGQGKERRSSTGRFESHHVKRTTVGSVVRGAKFSKLHSPTGKIIQAEQALKILDELKRANSVGEVKESSSKLRDIIKSL